ncbi:MAG: RNA polymerase factor sigma-32 [Rhodospirillales bacterium RIFCSPLOWO2_12_FULL_67_15]|nr:MAG: RNA polymerase factor sigma-32 [Rhodospirillales bacterium RIFCSPLOWO2_12_FULL_67_15]
MPVTLTLPVVPPDSGLQVYLREIWKFPILSASDEYMLARRFRDHGEIHAAHKLVTSHLRLVAKIAMGFRGYGLPLADLMSEGNIGLMKAVKKFEPERGFRLSTYAIWWIRAAITEYILKSWSMVKMGTVSAQKKLFFSLRGIKNKLRVADNADLPPDQAKRLAREIGVPEHDLVAMNRRMMARYVSLSAPIGDEDGIQFQDTLVDDKANPEVDFAEHEEYGQRKKALYAALATLPQREREILTERCLKEDPATLEDLGRIYGVSRERVRQLEARALGKLKKAMAETATAP